MASTFLETISPSSVTCPSGTGQNVGNIERLISLAGGSIIGWYGLKRGSLDGLLIAAVGGALIYRGVRGNCHVYRAFGISSNRDEDSAGVPAQYGFKVERSITVNRPAEELYRQWRNLENLPSIMRHLQSVIDTRNGRSHWVASGPMGVQVEWDAEIINEDPGRLIAWRSLPGSEVDTAGSVHFDERVDGRSTEVTVSLKYNPPGGQAGAGVAWLLGSGAEQQIEEDLRRFKQTMEAGEVPASGSTMVRGV
jgi:uncharacterized membrane protein